MAARSRWRTARAAAFARRSRSRGRQRSHDVASGRVTRARAAPAGIRLRAHGALIDAFKDAEGYWHAIYTNPLALGVRTVILTERAAPVPASWEDLKNEAYRGLIQMPSPQSSGTAYAVILTLREIMGEDGAFEYMKALNPNIQTYTQSGTAPSGALGVGETPIALQFSPGFLKLLDEGFPVEVIFPSEGVGYEVASMSILKGAQNLDEAKALVGITSLYVTHDQVEAMSISDRIVVLNAGVVEQVGTPTEVYSRPANRFIADFIGKANIFPAVAAAADSIELGGVRLVLDGAAALTAGAPVTVVIRPEAVAISDQGGDFRGKVARAMFLGNIAEYLVDVPGSEPWLVDSSNPGEAGLFGVGQEVFLTPLRSSIHVLS